MQNAGKTSEIAGNDRLSAIESLLESMLFMQLCKAKEDTQTAILGVCRNQLLQGREADAPAVAAGHALLDHVQGMLRRRSEQKAQAAKETVDVEN